MPYLALYRKYRPQTFDEVVGQDTVTRILKNQIISGRIGHAYLFTGIRGTGKTSIAKIFARAVNCENNTDGNPCNECRTCREIEKPGMMDIIEIDAASNRGVDEIRDIRDKVNYPPTLGKYKVYIIDEVHMLTKEAFNALLKTLEEPPSFVIFILATTEPNRLPMTILSRCQRCDIRPIPQDMIADRIRMILNDIDVPMDDDAVTFIAGRGDHSMRDALSLLDQIIDIREGDQPISYEQVLEFLGMADKKTVESVIGAIIDGSADIALEAVREMERKGRDAALIMEQLIDALRDLAVVGTTGKASMKILGITPEEYRKAEAAARRAGKRRLFDMIDTLIADREKLRYNDMAGTILEMSVLKLCVYDDIAAASDMPAPKEKTAPRKVGKKVRREIDSIKDAIIKMPPKPQAAPPDPEEKASRRSEPAAVDTASDNREADNPAPVEEKTPQQEAEKIKPRAEAEPEAGKTPQPAEEKSVNPARLSQAIEHFLLRNEPVLAHTYKKGDLVLKSSSCAALVFRGDGADAQVKMFSKAKKDVEAIVKKYLGPNAVFEVEKKNLEDVDFDELDFDEKVAAIVSGSNISIVKK